MCLSASPDPPSSQIQGPSITARGYEEGGLGSSHTIMPIVSIVVLFWVNCFSHCRILTLNLVNQKRNYNGAQWRL